MPFMPRDGTETRTRLLDAAERLVERNGFSGTSVEAILEESTSSKGAFFHHFPTKQALAHALVTRFVDADLAMLHLGLEHVAAEADPVAKVLGFVRFFEDLAEEIVSPGSSCLYIAALTEKDLLDAETAAEVERAIVTWRVEVASLLRSAYDAAGVDGPDPEELADHLFVTFEGAFLLCRSLHSAAPMRSQLRVYRELLATTLRAA